MLRAWASRSGLFVFTVAKGCPVWKELISERLSVRRLARTRTLFRPRWRKAR